MSIYDNMKLVLIPQEYNFSNVSNVTWFMQLCEWYSILNLLVCLLGLVSAVASPGAGLYADGSSSSFLAPFLKWESLAFFVAFVFIPL